ncbi:MAG: hypothetical protein HYW05_01795 [Candidatus Diapherotrites archaeon]|nr:hypothetical protein [Candidatus Diapherotrites archaeon]
MLDVDRIPGTNVFVGAHIDNPEFFKERNIKTVLTIAPVDLTDRKRFSGTGIKLIQIPAVNNDIYGVKTAYNFLKIAKGIRGKFAITCLAGLDASNIFAGVYLMSVKKYSFEKVMAALNNFKYYRPYSVYVGPGIKSLFSGLQKSARRKPIKRPAPNRFLKIKRGI